MKCPTFKLAAEKLGLLESDDTIRECLLEATSTRMPAALRRLFVTMLIFCEPSGVRKLWDEFHMHMSEDYPSSSSSSNVFIINILLRDLDRLLSHHNKRLSDFDLPRPSTDSVDPFELPKLIQDELSITISNEDLDAISKLNEEQANAYNQIMESVNKQENSLYFIDGPGGTGKTFLYRAILASIRSKGKIAIATATSGIASTLISGGRTTHSRFKIPIRMDSQTTCTISKQSNLSKLIQQASLIIWDEATMTHRHAFEALDRTLRDILSNDMPFGGNFFVFGGDFRQVLPVIRNGTRAETVDSYIVRSKLWDNIQVIRLKQNMRALNDTWFSKFLLRVGDGLEPSFTDDMIRIPEEIVIPWENEESLNSLIDFTFPNLIGNAHDKGYMTERALLTPKNENVDRLNEKVVKLFPGEEVTYFSFDSVDDDTHNLYQQEFLNSITPGGLPPHKLILKLGSPIMLLRNIDPTIGLCNGTRLICRGFRRNLIDAEIVTGNYAGTRVLLPRIPLKPSDNIHMPFLLIRKQFPVRLSFALTINKSQGQTIPHTGIYLPEHVFSHGQLYVALSRGVSRQTTKILIKGGSVAGCLEVMTKNVVYRDVLLLSEIK